MLTRYLITLGARTTAGGTVISAHSFRSINGVKVAIEDDSVDCPRCKSVGIIKPDGPRLRETCSDRQVALHDDLCVCKCDPAPRLIANQTLVCQRIDAEWQAAEFAKKVATVEESAATSQGVAGPDDKLPLLLLHPGTQEPIKHRPYRLELAGMVIGGMTDEHGATQPLTAADRMSLIAWHVSDETSAA